MWNREVAATRRATETERQAYYVSSFEDREGRWMLLRVEYPRPRDKLTTRRASKTKSEEGCCYASSILDQETSLLRVELRRLREEKGWLPRVELPGPRDM